MAELKKIDQVVHADEFTQTVATPRTSEDHEAAKVAAHVDAQKDTIKAEQQDRTSQGQRRINMIWEATQSGIAICVTITALATAATIAIRSDGDQVAFMIISNAFFLTTGFYFGRTNHERTGGIGINESGR